MFVADNGMMLSLTQGSNNIYPFKLFPGFHIFDRLPSRGTSLFSLQTGIYAAFINKNTFLMRYSL